MKLPSRVCGMKPKLVVVCYRSVTDISNTTRFESSIVVTILLTLMKLNKIEVVEQRGQEYLYALTEEAERI